MKGFLPGFLYFLIEGVTTVTCATMSSTVALGVEGVIEIDGAVQILAHVGARGEVSFVLSPGQSYTIHLHEASGFLLGIIHLDVPGNVDRPNDIEDGGEDGSSSPYGSGFTSPRTRRRSREVLRPRPSSPMRCSFRRRGAGRSQDEAEQTTRDGDELPANMAVRSRDGFSRPRDGSARVRDRSPLRRPSSSSDIDVENE